MISIDRRSAVRSAGAMLGLAALLCLGGCKTDASSFLNPQGVVAHHQLSWLVTICLAMSVVIVPVFILVPLFAWRYRYRSKAPYDPNWSFAWSLEFAVWGVPILVVVFLAGVIINQETRFDPYTPIASKQKPIEIDVIGLNWKWLFLYPEQKVASVGTMAFPADRPVTFRITSDKTIQSFFIPALGSQIYAMAGMVTQLNLMADHPGRFVGENTQFNGTEFERDRFIARGMTAQGFDAWVQAAKGNGRVLDASSFERLAQDGDVNNALAQFGADVSAGSDPIPRLEPGMQFSGYEPSLFNDVVDHFDAMASNTPKLIGPPAADTPSGMAMPAAPVQQR